MQRGNGYTIGFALAVCMVCSIFVSGAAVALKDRQDANRVLDRQKKVLLVAGLMAAGDKLPAEEIQKIYSERIAPKAIVMETGKPADASVDPYTFDMLKAAKDPALSEELPENEAKIRRMPEHGVIYEVKNAAGKAEMTILPIQGPGLWSTLYGYIALGTDRETIKGLIFYQHGETPGLGGEIDNPSWIAKWAGRKAFDRNGAVAIKVIKGAAGTPTADPHSVDGLSGATITGNGVTRTVQFWLGSEGFGPYLGKGS